MFLKEFKEEEEEEEEELEGTDPEAFKEFRRCAQESPHPDKDVKEDDDAMTMKTLSQSSSFRARDYISEVCQSNSFLSTPEKKKGEKKHI